MQKRREHDQLMSWKELENDASRRMIDMRARRDQRTAKMSIRHGSSYGAGQAMGVGTMCRIMLALSTSARGTGLTARDERGPEESGAVVVGG